MEEFALLAFGLLVAAAALIGSVLYYETAWKARRRRNIERDHFRSKLR